MANENLITQLREYADWARSNEWETPIMLSDHLEEAANALEAGPHWIPSKEHLPAYGEEVLTLGPNGGLDNGFFIGVASAGRPESWDWKKNSVKTVKYWMPRSALPPMPKNGGTQ